MGIARCDVCFHVVSPGSGGLFHRAISESNGCTQHQYSPADAEPATAQLVSSVGCSAGADVLACQRLNLDAPISVLTGVRRTECEFWWGVYDQVSSRRTARGRA